MSPRSGKIRAAGTTDCYSACPSSTEVEGDKGAGAAALFVCSCAPALIEFVFLPNWVCSHQAIADPWSQLDKQMQDSLMSPAVLCLGRWQEMPEPPEPQLPVEGVCPLDTEGLQKIGRSGRSGHSL